MIGDYALPPAPLPWIFDCRRGDRAPTVRGVFTHSFDPERDVSAVADLLSMLPAHARHRIEAGWRLAAPGFLDPADNVMVFDEDDHGKLLALAAWQQPWAVLDLWLRPDEPHSHVVETLLDWSRARFAQLDTARGRPLPYWIELGQEENVRRQIVARHGFDLIGENACVRLRRELSDTSTRSPVPQGYAIRPLAGFSEVPGYVAAHRAAFGSDAMTLAWRTRTLDMPGYEPELDLVAVTEDGTIAGFCVTWLDRPARQAQIEPIGVVPGYRRLGLARALMNQAAHHAARHGASALYVETNNDNHTALAAYADAGFHRIATIERRGRTGFDPAEVEA